MATVRNNTQSNLSVRAQLSAVGVRMKYLYETDEYKVNFVEGTEATAYYTDDIQDALATGLAMA
jgi:hypothetical protein